MCQRHIPTRRLRPQGDNWWTNELAELKVNLHTSRKRYQRARQRDLPNLRFLSRRYHFLRIKYNKAIRHAKAAAWRSFVQHDLTTDPWGTTYKLASGQISAREASHAILIQGTTTTNLSATLEEILNRLTPDDNRNDESPTHRALRADSERVEGNAEVPVEVAERHLLSALAGIKPRKAPGWDNIPGRAIVEIYPVAEHFLVSLFNDCLAVGLFPASWKIGLLTTILKSPDKDLADPKALRPITLLPELGKFFERTLMALIKDVLGDTLSHSQYGFRTGLSTIDPLAVVTTEANSGTWKYTLVIFLDIAGAFDNLWWPSIILAMGRKAFPKSILRVISSFLHGRTVSYSSLYCTVEKELTKGCPQGSVLGPFLWNLVLDEFLSSDLPMDCKSIAYADDLAIIVGGNSRRVLEQKAAACMQAFELWTSSCKLAASIDKTKYLIFGARLDRNPVVHLQGRPVSRSVVHKYLGVQLDDRLGFLQHVQYVVGKVKKLFLNLRRLVITQWDSPHNALLTIYKCAVLPILSYGLPIWGHRLQHSRVVRKLREIQGLCLRCVLRAYRTVPVEALCILARTPPLHLELAKLHALMHIKSAGRATFLGTIVDIRDFRYMVEITRHIDHLLVIRWQQEWDLSTKGRHLFRMIPNVGEWLGAEERRIPPRLVEIFTGHGEFGIHLLRIGKSPDGLCQQCQVIDDPLHRLLHCSRFDDIRANITTQLGGYPDQPEHLPSIILQFPLLFSTFGDRAENE